MKKILIGIAAVFLILLIVAFAVPYVISADTIKGPLILKIQALTGRKLRVDGALRVKFFPLAGITMEHVTLSNPAGFDDAAPFITLKSLDVGVAVMALLHNDIQIRQMVMSRISICTSIKTKFPTGNSALPRRRRKRLPIPLNPLPCRCCRKTCV
jgi:uncharacterized protein involved in outer membrane biogenesis